MSARYAPWRTIYTRFRRWVLDRTFTRMPPAQAMRDAIGDGWLVSVDSTVPRAHQHAVGAREEGQGGATKCVITPLDAPQAH
ncbi:hypothetical protein C0216_11005 [Streptomyces globosus]|uniref:Transposase n=1 Tax=Streptomyces globosus TaxID=68209 RepID=A0A344TZ44_9ACTN|nr:MULTISPECIES: hypothetical protein [Streptomyces]AXE23915.1 hypothetical protein C0216_11005 [Streptomyces globosus]